MRASRRRRQRRHWRSRRLCRWPASIQSCPATVRGASYLTRASSMTPKSYTDVSDQQVVVFAQEGREDAYRELIKRYERPVFSLIYRMVRDNETAEDLAQETFICRDATNPTAKCAKRRTSAPP